jgi:methyl-accepting chemotaxis protein
MNVGNLKIGTRLNLGFAVVFGLLLVVATIAWSQSGRLWRVAENFDAKLAPSYAAVFDFSGAIKDLRRLESQEILWVPDAQMLPLKPPIEESNAKAIQQAQHALEACARLAEDEESQQICDKLKGLLTVYLDAQANVIQLAKASATEPGKSLEAKKALWFGKSYDAFKALSQGFADWKKHTDTLTQQSVVQAQATHAAARVSLAIGVIAALTLGFGTALLITRSIVRPLREGLTAATAVASGDLRPLRISQSRDEVGQLMAALLEMQTNLASIVRDVRQNADGVATGSVQLAEGNIDLSARTEEQAASLEETAASMTQLTETVRQNTDNARHANVLAVNATEMVNAGNDAVEDMVRTIGQISGSSDKISEITGVIEGIAFQTNILALNAAVEAARAGEQGRGFAVVASEVRSLAQRSSAAAKEIKALIESSVALIHTSSSEAQEVGTVIGRVRQAVGQVADIVGEISAASEEQSRGIEQVNQAVAQMDRVTQQNAALVEEAAAAAQSLGEQAVRLRGAVSVFCVDGSEGVPRRD